MKHPKDFDENLEEYELFYLEIPKTDMDDIEIQDEYDKPEEEQPQDQSSDYTRASLEAARDKTQPESDDETVK